MNNQNLQEEKNDSQAAATPRNAASADSHQRVSDRILDIDEEMKSPHLTATPLAAAADSHQPMIENENPPLTDMPLVAAGSQQPILMSIPKLQEEGKDHQVPAMPLAAGSTNRNLQEEGSHQLSSVFDSEGNDIALDLPPEGSVVMVDSDIVPHLDLEKLFDNDVSKKRFTIDNAEEGGSVITLNDPVEVPFYSTQTLFLTGKANIPALERFCEREVKVELNQQFH